MDVKNCNTEDYSRRKRWEEKVKRKQNKKNAVMEVVYEICTRERRIDFFKVHDCPGRKELSGELINLERNYLGINEVIYVYILFMCIYTNIIISKCISLSLSQDICVCVCNYI